MSMGTFRLTLGLPTADGELSGSLCQRPLPTRWQRRVNAQMRYEVQSTHTATTAVPTVQAPSDDEVADDRF